MELAAGINWKGSEATALMVDATGQLSHRLCPDLAKHGIPARMGARGQLTIDFECWEPASFNEFACALGAVPLQDERHATWQFIHEGRRYVVPALVLMRALFRPTHLLIPELYRPQSLDDICTFSGETAGSHVSFVKRFGDTTRRARSSVLNPLSWFFCFPSARAAWSSVYRAGGDGRLAIELPRAQATFALKGLPHRRNVYVTALHIHEVTALEAPFDFASGHTRTISFLAGAAQSRREFSRPKRLVALRRGIASVSDVEWREIETLLDAGPAGRRQSVSMRSTLDGVLQKVCFGTPWQATAYPVGVTHSAAATALHRWRADGRWARVEAALERSRGRPDAVQREARHELEPIANST